MFNMSIEILAEEVFSLSFLTINRTRFCAMLHLLYGCPDENKLKLRTNAPYCPKVSTNTTISSGLFLHIGIRQSREGYYSLRGSAAGRGASAQPLPVRYSVYLQQEHLLLHSAFMPPSLSQRSPALGGKNSPAGNWMRLKRSQGVSLLDSMHIFSGIQKS